MLLAVVVVLAVVSVGRCGLAAVAAAWSARDEGRHPSGAGARRVAPRGRRARGPRRAAAGQRHRGRRVEAVAAARWGPALGGQVAGLGRLVNETLFDPDGLADPAAGPKAWQLADATVAALRAAPPVAAPEPEAAPADRTGQLAPV